MPPFRTSPEDPVARAKPALGGEPSSGKRLVTGVMRAFSDRLRAAPGDRTQPVSRARIREEAGLAERDATPLPRLARCGRLR